MASQLQAHLTNTNPLNRDTPMSPFQERISCTVAQATEATGIGRSKLYEEISSGRLKSIKYGKRRLILVRSLFEMLAQHLDVKDEE